MRMVKSRDEPSEPIAPDEMRAFVETVTLHDITEFLDWVVLLKEYYPATAGANHVIDALIGIQQYKTNQKILRGCDREGL